MGINMIKIKNKKESNYYIKLFGLNQFPKIVFKEFDAGKVLDFINKYDAKFYAVRDLVRANSSIFNLKVKKESLLDYTRALTDFGINVSSYNYQENQLLTGEVKIDRDLSVSLTASNRCDYSARDAVKNPDFNFVSDIFDSRIKNIDGLEQVINYIFKYNLFGIIVEFSSFDINLGTNNESVIVYELRTDY